MRIALTEEGHNHVKWEARSPVVWIEVGLLAGILVFSLLVTPSAGTLRRQAVNAVAVIVVALGGLLAATTPLVDRGHLERLPEGGDLKRSKVWLVVGERTVVDVALEDIDGFEVELETFEDVPPAVYRQARLWAVANEGSRYCLTDWAEADSVGDLRNSLGKAGRRVLG
ncbi:MAG: hypothetical protein MUQ30_01480 [Anaerolineae bacterium]|nr:hypothetical protein [Anaerolineae bacterium]